MKQLFIICCLCTALFSCRHKKKERPDIELATSFWDCGEFLPISKTVQLSIDMDSANVTRHNQLTINLFLGNYTDSPILIHRHIDFGYLSVCDTDFCFEVEKETAKGKYTAVEQTANIDRIAAYDSTGVAWDDMYDTLHTGKKFTTAFNINGYYSFDKGRYKVRFAYQPPGKGTVMPKIYSNWWYFNVKTKHVEFKI